MDPEPAGSPIDFPDAALHVDQGQAADVSSRVPHQSDEKLSISGGPDHAGNVLRRVGDPGEGPHGAGTIDDLQVAAAGLVLEEGNLISRTRYPNGGKGQPASVGRPGSVENVSDRVLD